MEIRRVGRRRVLQLGVALLPLAAAGCGWNASAPPGPATEDWSGYDDYLRRRATAKRFSGTVLVARDGRSLLIRGYGMADRSRSVANTRRTRFCIASMGKMLTAVAVAQLVERRQLSFSDPIGKYLPGFPPDVSGVVTVAHLLTHTSGMDDVALRPTPSAPPPVTLDGMLRRIVQAPLLFAPGSRFHYSNDGFIVLGAIIEQVSGVAYDAYIRAHVLEPASMTDTDVRPYTPDAVPGMAHGYARSSGPSMQPPTPPPGLSSAALVDVGGRLQIANPSGGAYSTVDDLHRFARALTAHRLLSPEMTTTVLAGRVNDHRPGGPAKERYGYGFDNQWFRGVRIVGHNGGTPGYEGQLDIYPEQGYVVVVLANEDGVMVPAIQRSERILTG